jgi:plastocyanin
MRSGVVGIGGLLLLVACGGGGTDPGNGGGGGAGGGGGTLVHAARVTAGTALAFTPQTQTIPAGDSIFFTFGPVQHSVHFTTAGAPADVGVSQDETIKRKFPTVGTYDYYCTVHGTSMNGHIVVQ